MGSADGHAVPAAERPRRLTGRLRRAALGILVVLVAAAVVLAALGATGRLPDGLVADPEPTPTPTRPLDPAPADAPAVLAAEPTVPAATLSAALTEELDRVLDSGALGPGPGAVVLDATTGARLLDRDGDRPRTPASVAKLATGAAAVTVLDPSTRLRTRVVAGPAPGEVVLVGAGDATLTTAPVVDGGYPVRASIAALADQVVTALLEGGLGEAGSVAVRVDDGLFTGPAASPEWPASYVGSGVVSPVSALSVDAGRTRRGSDTRERDPALAAGRTLVRLLRQRGLAVSDEVSRAPAPAGAQELAAALSPTVGEMVELMLAESDNDLAEALLRLVAVERARPGTFLDGTSVVLETLAGLGVPANGTVLLDGSGLARGSVVAPATLAALLVRAVDGSDADLARLASGLPVAGFTGTLSLRFDGGREAGAAGIVRAKTGTLTGVSTLAGVTSLSGRPVAFVVMADRVPGDTLAAREALDRFATELAVP